MSKAWKSSRPFRRFAELVGYGWSTVTLVAAIGTAVWGYIADLAAPVIATMAILTGAGVLWIATTAMRLLTPSKAEERNTVVTRMKAGDIATQHLVELEKESRAEARRQAASARAHAETARADRENVAAMELRVVEMERKLVSKESSLNDFLKLVEDWRALYEESQARHEMARETAAAMNTALVGPPSRIAAAMLGTLFVDAAPVPLEERIEEATRVYREYQSKLIYGANVKGIGPRIGELLGGLKRVSPKQISPVSKPSAEARPSKESDG